MATSRALVSSDLADLMRWPLGVAQWVNEQVNSVLAASEPRLKQLQTSLEVGRL